MTITTTTGTDREQALVGWAHELGEQIAPHAARHDQEGSFVSEAFELLRSSGFLAIAVPEELGGQGASIREVAMAQRELAKHCGSTALASAMHQHITLFGVWRYRRGMPGADVMLRRIAEERIIMVSTGGADFTRPRGTAVPVDGGFRVTGHKVFCSQVPAGDVFSTLFVVDDPKDGKVVLSMAVPVTADGVTVFDNWDTLGMRGTGSNDVEMSDVFVPEAAVAARRPWGVIDPPLQIIGTIAMSVINGVYLGVAEAAGEAAVAAVAGTAKADDPGIQRQVGEMNHRLRIMRWAFEGGLAAAGDNPDPSVHTFDALMGAKREIALGGVEVCDLAMEIGGGPAFFRTSPIERCYRDIRAAKFHPLTPEQTLFHTGRLALGLPVDELV